MESSPERRGVRLDPAKFDFELGRRGLTGRRLAELAGIHEVVLSRARCGHPIASQTLERITRGLLQAPLIAGADLLILAPLSKSTADGTGSSAVVEEVLERASARVAS